jgi:hypothetical protein
MATFFSYNALVSQRASGYRNTTYALAELIDNSFDAEANSVHIVFIEKRVSNRRHIEEVLIQDDGKGMSSAVLQEALQFGNTTNQDIDAVVKSKKKGKFGYGLPNASLSQCPAVHVYSWQDEQTPGHVYLDLQELSKSESIEIPLVEKEAFPPYYKDVLPSISKSGTLVAWRRCDRLSYVKGETIIENSQKLLGRLYRHLLAAGKQISFSVYLQQPGKPLLETTTRQSIVPNDPLFLLKNTQLAPVLWAASQSGDGAEKMSAAYKQFSKSKTECLPTNIRLTDNCLVYRFEWLGRTYAFEITTSCADISIQKPGIREGGNTKVGMAYGAKEAEGNISFVRAEREIAAGHFGFYKPTDARHRWWSIEIQFDADADDLIGVHNNKQGIEFIYTALPKYDGDDLFNKYEASLLQARHELWKELSKCIENARKAAFTHVKQQGTSWDAQHMEVQPDEDGVAKPQVPKGTDTTAGVIKTVDGARKQPLSDASKQELVNRLQTKYPDIHQDEILSAVVALDKAMVRACVLYAPSEATQLWSFTKVFDFLVVLINTRHEFYSRVLSELRAHGQDGALSAIELFISSLAVEEEKFVTRGDAADIVEEFRTLVGVHLHSYIKRLPESVTMMTGLSDGDSEHGEDEGDDERAG